MNARLPRIADNPRWRLRAFRAGDRDAIADMHRQDRLSTHLLDDEPLDTPALASRLLRMLASYEHAERGFGMWAAEQRVPGYSEAELIANGARDFLSDEAIAGLLLPRWRFAGWFNLSPVPGEEALIELGSRLVPAVWGSPLSLLGGDAVLDHGFSLLGVTETFIHCDPRNRPALYCAFYLGFDELERVVYLGKPACRLRLRRDRFETWREQGSRVRRVAALARARADVPDMPVSSGASLRTDVASDAAIGVDA